MTSMNNINDKKRSAESSNELTLMISNAMDGDIEAIRYLFDHYENYILNLVRVHIYDREDLEDVFQEIAIEIFQSISKLQSPYSFNAWLRQLVLNVCSSYNRRNSKHKNNVSFDELNDLNDVMLENENEIPETAYESSQKRELVYSALNRLSTLQRKVLFSYYGRGLSYKAIAKEQGISSLTVGSTLAKARVSVKNLLKDDVKELFGGALVGSIASQGQTGYSILDFMRRLITGIKAFFTHSHAAAVKVAVGSAAMLLVWAGVTFIIAPMVASDSTAEKPLVNTQGVQYHPQNAEIIFHTSQALSSQYDGNVGNTDNVNPLGASIIIGDDRGMADSWEIMNAADEQVVVSGMGDVVQIPQLEKGYYSLSFKVVADNVAVSYVVRDFFIE